MLRYGPIQWKNHASIVVMSLQISHGKYTLFSANFFVGLRALIKHAEKIYIWFSNHYFNKSILAYIKSNRLANFIETEQILRCDIQVVVINQIKKGRHNMLWCDFLN